MKQGTPRPSCFDLILGAGFTSPRVSCINPGRKSCGIAAAHVLAFTCLAALLVAPGVALAQGREDHQSVASDGSSVTITPSTGPEAVAAYEGNGQVSPVPAESTDEVWRLWGLKALTGPVGIETIIGTDDRTRITSTKVFPYSAVTLVTSDSGRCTGWLFGKDIVATAGHCVHGGGPNGKWKSNVHVYPGRDGNSAPYGMCSAKTLYSVRGWTEAGKEEYDYGAIKLNCVIGHNTGWFGYFWQASTLDGLPSEVAGYPGDKPLEQWKSPGSVSATTTFQVFYQNDTIGGNSGGPVFYKKPNCGVCSMGVHAYGLHGGPPHSNNNHSTRITQPVFENLQAWKAAP